MIDKITSISVGDLTYPEQGSTSYCKSCTEFCQSDITQFLGGIANTLGSWVIDIIDCADDPPLLFGGAEISSGSQVR